MKKLLLVLLALPLLYGCNQNEKIVNIPDANFKAYLLGNSLINTNGDTEIQVTEANAFNGGISLVEPMEEGEGGMDDINVMMISNLTGIEAFTALTLLNCWGNLLTSLDVSQNIALTDLECGGNNLTSLDVSGATALTKLNCQNNQLTSLDVSQNTALTDLYCDLNILSSLDVSKNTALTFLSCGANDLTSLDVSQNTALTELDCGSNQFDCEALKKKYKIK
jgi:hypothetical protein